MINYKFLDVSKHFWFHLCKNKRITIYYISQSKIVSSTFDVNTIYRNNPDIIYDIDGKDYNLSFIKNNMIFLHNDVALSYYNSIK